MVSDVLYVKYVPEKEINLTTICHRTASTRGKTWRTGWPGYSLPTRTPRRPWRSGVESDAATYGSLGSLVVLLGLAYLGGVYWRRHFGPDGPDYPLDR